MTLVKIFLGYPHSHYLQSNGNGFWSRNRTNDWYRWIRYDCFRSFFGRVRSRFHFHTAAGVEVIVTEKVLKNQYLKGFFYRSSEFNSSLVRSYSLLCMLTSFMVVGICSVGNQLILYSMFTELYIPSYCTLNLPYNLYQQVWPVLVDNDLLLVVN